MSARERTGFVPYERTVDRPAVSAVEAAERTFVAHKRHPLGYCPECRRPLEDEADRWTGGCLNAECDAYLQAVDREIWRRVNVGEPALHIAHALGLDVQDTRESVVRMALGEEGVHGGR